MAEAAPLGEPLAGMESLVWAMWLCVSASEDPPRPPRLTSLSLAIQPQAHTHTHTHAGTAHAQLQGLPAFPDQIGSWLQPPRPPDWLWAQRLRGGGGSRGGWQMLPGEEPGPGKGHRQAFGQASSGGRGPQVSSLPTLALQRRSFPGPPGGGA